ncbi:GMC oxidoreductase [Shimia marina]|uniref:6'''-hydroxyparomomycin C oxidase n=1 Tax=Shimia marina TaxID=321267 RepID=A0A0P1FAQ0_9RHOB|nr:GMC family oxidoreductase [Shimia marina]CUH52043.1 6'''-hydroxyparomomycin C oxidase [Shimia marina]SFE61241.1 Choline dehydrogenase [Shimia marina]
MDADVVIIGSGIGGASMAAALAPSGKHIVVLERGEPLRPGPQDRDAKAIFGDGCFRSGETWLDGAGRAFSPGNYHYVGGNSKFYGAVMLRYREADFRPVEHREGTTPGWPISYADLAPDYTAAEALFKVRGAAEEDPTDPARGCRLPFDAVQDEPDIADLRKRLRGVGLKPASLPLALDIETWLAHGQTTWDAYPNTCAGKHDGETVLMQACVNGRVALWTGCDVHQLEIGVDGRVSAVHYRQDGKDKRITAPVVVLAAGAVHSAALLLSSANDNFPTGLANSSDQVGRNFMNHNCSAVLALHPLRRNHAVYQKTLMMNDYYHDDGQGGAPLGNVQMLGKITGPILAATSGLPGFIAQWIAARSFDFYAMSEDLPQSDSRVTVKNGQISLAWQRSNWSAHEALVKQLKVKLRQAGCPVVLSRAFDRTTPSHQCGTARMGKDPAHSVVDRFGRCHDHPNLFISDASVLPTSAAVNPALTIAALALRSGQHILETEFAT